MSVDFARADAACMAYHRVSVSYWEGWERRSNGQPSN